MELIISQIRWPAEIYKQVKERAYICLLYTSLYFGFFALFLGKLNNAHSAAFNRSCVMSHSFISPRRAINKFTLSLISSTVLGVQ